MSISIYYEVRLPRQLTASETTAIRDVLDRYSVEREIERHTRDGTGLNWESFGFYGDVEGDETLSTETILEGSTALPDNTEDAVWIGVKHWCDALTEMRNAIPDAEWHVQVEDYEIRWDEVSRRYDPSK